MREEMDPANYDQALVEAAKLDDAFTDPKLEVPDPNKPPKPPFIEKPIQSDVAKLLPEVPGEAAPPPTILEP